MIKNIFWDIDECLIHTSVNLDPEQSCLTFALENDLAIYYTIVRPCAFEIIEYSRALVGADHVYILTSSTRDYATEISKLAGWNFDDSHILTRETLQSFNCSTAYNNQKILVHETSHKDNVIIDNLPARYNEDKINFIGIVDYSRYFKVHDYYGNNLHDECWKQDVMNFLNDKHKE